MYGHDESELLSVEIDMVQFPNFCPVCGDPATDKAHLKAAESRKTPKRTSYYRSWKQTSGPASVKSIMIPVCDRHYYSVDDYYRLKVLGGIISTVSTIALFLLLFQVIGAFQFGTVLEPILFVVGGVFFVLFFIGYQCIKPSAVEEAVDVVGVLPGSDSVLIKVKDKRYRDELLRLNPMTAKLYRRK